MDRAIFHPKWIFIRPDILSALANRAGTRARARALARSREHSFSFLHTLHLLKSAKMFVNRCKVWEGPKEYPAVRTRLPIAHYGRYISRALHHSSLSLYETPSGLLYLLLLRLPPPLSLLLDSIVILILYYLGSHRASRGPANATPESQRRMGKFRRSAPVSGVPFSYEGHARILDNFDAIENNWSSRRSSRKSRG